MAHAISRLDKRSSILVVDNHPIFRKGVAVLINDEPDIVVCGEAGDVTTAIQAIETCLPDLVLLDLRVSTSDIFELIKGFKSRFPALRVLVLSAYDEAIYAERALRAGACGYAIKEDAPAETLSAIRAVLSGEMYLSRHLASCLLQKLVRGKPVVRDARVDVLSDRELQVFRMLGAGLGTREIAEDLGLSIKTIETYRENIKHKLGLRNSCELLRVATQWVQTAPKLAVTKPAGSVVAEVVG